MVKYFKSGVKTVAQLGLITGSAYSLQYMSANLLFASVDHTGAVAAIKIFTDLCLLGSVALVYRMRE